MLRPFISFGITGGIGSGKSYVCRQLAERYGVPIYYTDTEARRLMATDADLHVALAQLVGEPVVNSQTGELNRSLISTFIRTQADGAQRVNALVHPCVRRDMRRWMERQSVPFVVVECALLFESGFNADVDYSILVTAPLDVRVDRVMARDGKSREEVLHWMSLQMDESEKRRRADFVINNGGNDDLLSQFHNILHSLHLA